MKKFFSIIGVAALFVAGSAVPAQAAETSTTVQQEQKQEFTPYEALQTVRDQEGTDAELKIDQYPSISESGQAYYQVQALDLSLIEQGDDGLLQTYHVYEDGRVLAV
ncbi:hypothetical protein [Marinococcus halotolerans]|uniref:hypothetical protein n=1 Tax=Marinococcus halotolerans TaxID=301092 RepID=UPI0003B5D418|nr:hypothetical protein [Marinococcus halotolerans]